jgi:Uma2 family endonuclease
VEYSNSRVDSVVFKRISDMTSLEYFQSPESLLPTELSYGTLHVRDAPSSTHQRAVAAFFWALRSHVRARRLGEVWLAPLDVVLDEARALIVQPDLFYVSCGREKIVQGRVYGPPDLVVEVLSPTPRVGDFERRLVWFADYGVNECWAYHQLADCLEIISFVDRSIRSRTLVESNASIVSACLPEFSLTLREILDS